MHVGAVLYLMRTDMATILNRENGRRSIQFLDQAGERRTFSLGKMDAKSAAAIKMHVERMINARTSGQPVPPDTASWLGTLDARLHDRLAKAGLIAPRADAAPAKVSTLRLVVDAYVARRTDLKRNTLNILDQAGKKLLAFFGEDRNVAKINVAEAKDWRRHMGESLSGATVAAYVKKAKEIFADALERGIVPANVFAKLKAGSQANDARNVYVPVEDVLKVIAECPNAEWRLIFAMARFGGVRTPSEPQAIGWADVNWEASRFTVRAAKTARHPDGGVRVVPIFPELRPYLREAFEQAEPGAINIIGKLRGENLRTTAEKIIARAGVKPWPRLFQNLRASRQTDLARVFPLHVVCAWIGNSEMVARKHYLKVNEMHFDQAAKSAAPGAAEGGGTEANGGTASGEKGEESPGLAGISGEVSAPGGNRTHAELRGEIGEVHKAMQRALRRYEKTLQHVTEYAGRRRHSDISELRQKVDAARAAGDGEVRA